MRLKRRSATQASRLHLGSGAEGGKASRRRGQLPGLVRQGAVRAHRLERGRAAGAPWFGYGERCTLVKAKRLQHARAT